MQNIIEETENYFLLGAYSKDNPDWWKQCVEDNIPYTILEHDGYFINHMPDDVLENFTDVLKLDNLDPYSKNYNEEIDSASLNKINYINSRFSGWV